MAYAVDCNQDIGALYQEASGHYRSTQSNSPQGGKKQLDPVASCPKLRALVAVEHELLAYLTKNKEWCAVPDEAFQNISASTGKSGKVADQACKVAAADEESARAAGRGRPQCTANEASRRAAVTQRPAGPEAPSPRDQSAPATLPDSVAGPLSSGSRQIPGIPCFNSRASIARSAGGCFCCLAGGERAREHLSRRAVAWPRPSLVFCWRRRHAGRRLDL